MRPALGAIGAVAGGKAMDEGVDFYAEAPAQASYFMASMEDAQQSTAVSSETKETGETFQYIVSTPVTVKRGESALVPILGHTVNYERELLYNRAKFPDHPVAAIRFDNQSGLTLERGPVTLVEDSDYKGEAVIPFTRDNNQVYVPYAVELGVKVTEHHEHIEELRGLSIDQQVLKQEIYAINTAKYVIENSTDKDKVVTVEEPLNMQYELFDTLEPDVKNATERRWRLNVPAGGTHEFRRFERRKLWRSSQIRGMRYHDLDRYMENRYIDKTLLAELRKLLDTLQTIHDMQAQWQALAEERNELYQQQEQYHKNMASLGSTGKEGTLRQRVVDQLEASQDRLETIDHDIADFKRKIEDTEKQVDAMIAGLGKQA